jgi:hypothetical protein
MERYFEYQPLQTGEIRLVRLKLAPNAKDFPLGGGPSRESGPFYAPIECEIANYSLRHCPHFTALSYTWDTEEDQKEIKLMDTPGLFGGTWRDFYDTHEMIWSSISLPVLLQGWEEP